MAGQVAKLRPADALVLLAIGLGGWWLAQRAALRLDYSWRFDLLGQFFLYAGADGWHAGRLLSGFIATIRLSLWAALLALGVGTLAGLARCSLRPFWRMWGGAYVLLVRNTPPLVLIFIGAYFLGGQIVALLGLDARIAALPEALRPGLEFFFGPSRQIPAFLAAVITLGLIEGAYVAEMVRGGVNSVESGQWDAAKALGLPRWRQLAHVVLPQAFRRVLPGLTGQMVSTLKDSAIVSVVAIPELTFQAQELVAATYRAFEVWTLVFVLYLALGLPCSLAARALEKRLSRSEREQQAPAWRI